MSENFDWQTEDDSGWETAETPPQPPGRSPKRQWRVLLMIGVLLIVAALAVYWQFARRIETLTAAIETDVLSSHNLVNRAVADQDLELFAPLLSARQPVWTNTYEQLLEQGLFYDRSFMSMPLAAASDAYADLSPTDEQFIRVDVAPDMNAAELYFFQEHKTGNGEEAVMLEHTAVYRRGRTRWLLAPPDEAFWGGWQTAENRRLTLTYPERDTAVVERLAKDLTAVITTTCRQINPLVCPNDLRLTVRLDSDPASLLALTDPANLYDGNLRLNLPAPTLVGLPVDEAGYEALLRGYGAAVAAALITELAEWECCAHAPVYQAFLEYQLSQMGLRPWPVTPATHAQVINTGIYRDTLFRFWQESTFQPLTDTDGWQLYAFVDFFMRQSAAPPPITVLTSLNEPQILSQWLAGLLGAQQQEGEMVQERLLRDWWLFAHSQLIASQGPLPIPLPEHDLLLTCTAEFADSMTSTLYRYHLADESWQEEFVLDGLMFASPLPDDQAVVLQAIWLEDETYETLLWRDGAGSPTINTAYPLAFSWGQVDPDGRYLLVYAVPADGMDPHPMLVDLAACNEAGCESSPLSGIPIWSPNGEQMLLAAAGFLGNGLLAPVDGRVLMMDNTPPIANVPLYRADATGQPASQIALPAPGGDAPFWIDDETYGYLQTIPTTVADSEQQVMIATTADDMPQRILGTAELLAALPEGARPLNLSIRYILPHPQRPEWLVVMATSRAQDFIFLVNWREGIIENRLQFNHISPHYLGFSPDGRYLVTTGAPQDVFLTPPGVFVYYLHDLVANQTRTFMAGSSVSIPAFTFDWSADGRWLAQVMNNGIINLVAPDYNYQTLIVHDHGSCSALAWVNP